MSETSKTGPKDQTDPKSWPDVVLGRLSAPVAALIVAPFGAVAFLLDRLGAALDQPLRAALFFSVSVVGLMLAFFVASILSLMLVATASGQSARAYPQMTRFRRNIDRLIWGIPALFFALGFGISFMGFAWAFTDFTDVLGAIKTATIGKLHEAAPQ